MNPNQHLITLSDWDRSRIERVLELAAAVKRDIKARNQAAPKYGESLKGRTAAMIFEKPSLRTKVTFEVAMVQTGGAAIDLDPKQISLGKRESVRDAAMSLSRWVDVIIARTFSHGLVTELAEHAQVPVINALTDLHHPCQALALGQTLMEKFGRFRGLKIVFVGDGNNVANSIAELAGHLGMHFTLACPKGYEQPEAVRKGLEPLFAGAGTRFETTHDAAGAAQGADLLYTDVWVSMGEEGVAAEKKRHFEGFQINSALLAAAPGHCLVSHCLPAHVGEEITEEIMASPRCVCFDEAENRLHAQKAALLHLLGRAG
jgi:ornithine carbamoyltransferase